MEMVLASVRASGASKSDLAKVGAEYLERCGRYLPAKSSLVRSAEAVFELRAKPASHLILLDSRGQLVSSEELAEMVRRVRDGGKRTLIFAIGPADGWTQAQRNEADAVISLGRITLPHELAAVVMAEQMYRACTILAGHPYHCGH